MEESSQPQPISATQSPRHVSSADIPTDTVCDFVGCASSCSRPRMSREHIGMRHHLSRTTAPVSVGRSPSTEVVLTLKMFEALAASRRNMRGILAIFAVLVIGLSCLREPEHAFLINVTIFLISQIACLVISKLYEVEASQLGTTNILFESRNIFTSPYLVHMLVEIILWNIQTPPIVTFWPAFFDLLNYTIILRLYAIVIYFSHLCYQHRIYPRALATMADWRLGLSFFLRTSLRFWPGRVLLVSMVTLWPLLGLLYARAESTSVMNGLWFSFQAITALGFGDYTPITAAGRGVCIMGWACRVGLLAVGLVVLHGALSCGGEGNLFRLWRVRDMGSRLRWCSAMVIQTSWRLRMLRRIGGAARTRKQTVRMIFLSAKLTFIIAFRRHTQRRIRMMVSSFVEPNSSLVSRASPTALSQHELRLVEEARHHQRRKDAERMYMSLRDCHETASSLSRSDIYAMLALSDRSGSHGRGCEEKEMAASTSAVAEMREQIVGLEEKCSVLARLLDKIATGSTTIAANS